ncbi:outer membrane beta-barrel protein [Saccharicrinis sp. FJH2]|uniref:outer membrane beta-barrel protein n=1 Tax=Saccharicrinis sp. FJH65 TaxID=3344659 RepID=UPI0035F2831B
MKKLLFNALFSILFLCLNSNVYSQHLKISSQILSTTFTDDVFSYNRNESGVPTFHLSYGLTYGARVSSNFGLDVGLLVSNNGQKRQNNKTGSYRIYKLTYLKLPLRPYYEFKNLKHPNFTPRISFGPEINFLINSRVTEYLTTNNNGTDEEIDLSYGTLDGVIDVGMQLGAYIKVSQKTSLYIGLVFERSITPPLEESELVFSFSGQRETQTLSSKFTNFGLELGLSW